MLILLLLIGAVGHAILWVALVNRIHAISMPRVLIDGLTLLFGLALAIAPLLVGLALLPRFTSYEAILPVSAATVAWTYVVMCALVAGVAGIQRLLWRIYTDRTSALVSIHSSSPLQACELIQPLLASGIPAMVARIPGNQVCAVSVQEKEIAIPCLLADLDGLTIVHLTDLHMSGRVTRAYFEHVVDLVNQCQADLIAITGDIIERPECIDWVPQTLARLRAAAGVYFVLGNHDMFVGKPRITAALTAAGLHYLGGVARDVTIRGQHVLLAGNEIPWFHPAADLGSCTSRKAAGSPLRIALAHTPDQLPWAKSNDIDLMLAGHNHGGQICFPLIGPITSPSLHGVRYAGGTFRSGNTVLHVSRGVSSLTPLRWNCPPEIALLKLRPAIRAI